MGQRIRARLPVFRRDARRGAGLPRLFRSSFRSTTSSILVEASLARLRVLGDTALLESVKIIVVDDGSSDATPEALDRFRAALESQEPDPKISWVWVRHKKNAGKGAAIRTGLTLCRYRPCGDSRRGPRVSPARPTEDGGGVSGRGGGRGFWFAVHGGRVQARAFLPAFAGQQIPDVPVRSGLRPEPDRHGDVLQDGPRRPAEEHPTRERDVRRRAGAGDQACETRSRIFEVAISYSGRTYREGKKIGWKDGVRAIWAIFHYAMSGRIYATDEHGGEILDRLTRAPRFTRWMADVMEPYVGDRVLEVGAGTGNMSMNLMPRSIYWATDVNPAYLEYLVTLRATRPYMRVAHTDAMDAATFPTGQQFDTVVCLNVVEHVQDDVAALRNIWNALEIGGRAVILVPCGPWLYGTLDEVLGHFRRYTEKQLRDVAEQAGFHVEQVLKFNRPGVPAWWLNGRILRRRTFGIAQIRILNFLTPLFRLVDRWLPLPPLSLIAVLRKRRQQLADGSGTGPDANGKEGDDGSRPPETGPDSNVAP